MRNRHLALIVAAMLLLVPATAMAGDGHTSVEHEGYKVENDHQHETRITLPVEGGPQEVGQWGAYLEGEIPAVNLAVLPGGDLLYYDGVEANEEKDEPQHIHFMNNATPHSAQSRVATIDGDTISVETPTPEHGGAFDLFCSGTTITPEGIAVAPGATQYYTLDQDPPKSSYTPLKGWNQTMLFPMESLDDEGDDWVPGPNMTVPRWYPSSLQLSNGDTLVASGIRTLFWPNTYNTLIETFDPDTEEGWEDLDTSFKVAEDASVPQRIVPETPDSGNAIVDETHRGVPNLPMYPRLHTIPAGPNAGEVLYTSNGDVWGPFGESPAQPLFGHFQTLDTDEGNWTIHDRSVQGTRNLGTTVPLMLDAEDPEPRYLSFGGTVHQTGAATSTSEIIDASGETVTSELTDSLDVPRWSVNGVLLPDGSVIAIGGSTYDTVLMYGSPTIGPLNAERFVPNEDGTDGEWERLPAMEDVRTYHSGAVLLPDGRVAVGGHVPLPALHHAQRDNGNPQPNDTSFELYEPAYLHHPNDETRPSIDTLGGVDLPGEATALSIPDDEDTKTIGVSGVEGELDSLVLRRPGATTHQYNADQLGVEVNILEKNIDESGTGTVTFEAPHDLAIPPGHYMLFANEDTPTGLYPSEAAWVALGDDVSLDN